MAASTASAQTSCSRSHAMALKIKKYANKDQQRFADAMSDICDIPIDSPDGMKDRAHIGLDNQTLSFLFDLFCDETANIRMRCKALNTMGSLAMSLNVAKHLLNIPDEKAGGWSVVGVTWHRHLTTSSLLDTLLKFFTLDNVYAQSDVCFMLGWYALLSIFLQFICFY